MTHIHKRALFIFRQDLRTVDNTGLRKAIHIAKEVVPIFIFDTDILENFPDGDKRLGFLVECLEQIDQELHAAGSYLSILHGKATDIIPEIVQKRDCDCIVWNKSYGQGSRTRDITITSRASSQDIDYYETPDYLLVEPELVEQRKVFTPFYKLRMEVPKSSLRAPAPSHISTPPLEPLSYSIKTLKKTTELLDIIGGATQSVWKPLSGREFLQKLPIREYDKRRNIPSDSGTSRLSPHLAFGTVSIREVFKAGLNRSISGVSVEDGLVTMDRKIYKDSFISELARREYWQHVAYYFPDSREIEFQEKRRGLKRVNNLKRLEHRKNGTTGYPIVDAAMRQLKEENWMHGRCRMIVASFLTKDMMIDRRYGEEHFKDYLIDYDKAVNMGNWQRSASVGADPKPLRIFNPILQSQRFDPEAVYIKKRLPELKHEPLPAIHDPLKYGLNYTKPVVDHHHMQRQAKLMYKKEEYTL